MKNALRVATAVALLTPLALLGLQSGAAAQSKTFNTSGYVVQGSNNQDVPGVGNLSGTIVAIDGHMLTVQVGPEQRVMLNDLPAASIGQTGPLYTGRAINARGYWDAGAFMAVEIG